MGCWNGLGRFALDRATGLLYVVYMYVCCTIGLVEKGGFRNIFKGSHWIF